MSKVEQEVMQLIAPAISRLGYELYGVDYHKEGAEFVLEIVIDHENGIDLDACERVSREIEPMLDQADPIPESYMLCVSSPGADRPIKTEDELEKNLEKLIEVRLFTAFQGGKKHKGRLMAYDPEHITILDRNKKITIPRDMVCLIKQDIDFSFKGENGNEQ